MVRIPAAVAAALLLAGLATSQDKAREVTIRWHGQSFFQIDSSRGTRIVIDPHAIEAYGRKSLNADLVLISHFHNDHTQLEPIQNRTKAKILYGLRGIPGSRRTEWNPINETFKDVHVRAVGTYHDNAKGMERGLNTAFVLEVDGVNIVHLGDLGHTLSAADVKKIGPVDVLMIPVGGVYTLNGSEARKVVEQLKPRQFIIPMHYGTRVYEDLLPPDEFLDEQKNVKKLPGNKLTTEAGFKPPEPIIVLLGWQ
jgi:L-ascorbate metabolism protein UlaG (beta-lactamase superfamily)